jgi:hypothetical protein
VHKFNMLIREVARMPNPSLQIKPHANGAVVLVGNNRRQRIVVERRMERYVMTSIVVGRARVEGMRHAALLPRIWQRNRETNVVAYSLDRRGRLVGRIEQLADTLNAVELAFYIQLLACECDQFEYVLSGRDR